MIETIDPIRRAAQVAGARPMQGIDRSQRPAAAERKAPSGGFGDILKRELAKSAQPEVNLSKHAISRAEERGIEFTPDLMSQLAGSVIRAQEKGATNILAMDTTKAFIINVPTAKVITAITQAEMKENIFTNIDGAVFL